MNKKILENKISELLGVSENEKSLAFGIFKNKLSEFLKVGEAIKISNIGVFQLKEKLDHGEENKFGSKNRYTLVCSPVVDDPSSDSLFINLEIDQPLNDESSFNENVFQLGIGKSLLTNLDENIGEEQQGKSASEKIEDSVASVIEEAEKLEGYDLWEDYLERKETKSLLDDPDNSDLTIDAIVDESDDEMENINLNDNEEESEFIPQDEDDLLDEIMRETDLLNEDVVEKKSDNLDIDDIQIPNLDEESAIEESGDEEPEDDLIEEADEQLDNDKIVNEFENEISDEIGDNDKKDGSIIEQIDEQIEELEDGEKLSLENPIYGDSLDEIHEEEIDSSIKDDTDEINKELAEESSDAQIIEEVVENKEEVIENEEVVADNQKDPDENEEKVLEEEQLSYEANEPLSEVEETNKPKRKLLILLLIAAFIILGAVSVYYMLFSNSSVNINDKVNEQAIVEEDNEKDALNPQTEDENLIVDSPNDVINEIKEVEDSKIGESTSVLNENMDKKEDAIADETEVSENIFFDGFVYNVQVSSWKQESIAQKEVNKLIKRGFPAYKVEAYIEKFKGTWYRVRIGPFPSLVEANELKQKVNK